MCDMLSQLGHAIESNTFPDTSLSQCKDSNGNLYVENIDYQEMLSYLYELNTNSAFIQVSLYCYPVLFLLKLLMCMY
jgi:hypothetical protein